ncbi:hypothetical protein [uncultured Roseibium sp.]|uniref:hypothetical protein n=1 Tax=uncultured Roseibium sp. TaxID=1936171 RepID=UPI003216B2C0
MRSDRREPSNELLHLDIKKLGLFERTGHRITGSRQGRNQGASWDYVHVAIDDATQLAYVEVLPGETRRSTACFLIRALRKCRARGAMVQRVLIDKWLQRYCRAIPKGHGKAERFILTKLREWANAIPFNPSLTREINLSR